MIDHYTIREVFDKYGTDKGRDHCYEHMYADIFSSNKIDSLLEIGVREGKSIAAWRHLFPSMHITGVDIQPPDRAVVPDAFDFVLCDSTSPNLHHLIEDKYDLIIDDGSHYWIDQIDTFINLANKFNSCYVIEDVYHHLDPKACDHIEKTAKELGFINNIKRYLCDYNSHVRVN
jgi:hypothetical protein